MTRLQEGVVSRGPDSPGGRRGEGEAEAWKSREQKAYNEVDCIGELV